MRWKRPSPLQIARYSVQVVVAAYVLVIVLANTAGEKWAANLHTICPFGGVVNLYTYFSTGGYVAKLHSAVFVMLLALLIGLVLTGKSFCGWICPLGSFQEWLGALGGRLWPAAYNKVPRGVDRVLGYLKYFVLVWVLVQTARTARLIFQDWDPYYTLYRIWTDEIALTGYVVTALTLLASLFIPRPFCRYACPLGAFSGLFNWFSFIAIKRDAGTCNDCGLCVRVCPVNIDLCAGSTVRSVECTRCLKCVEACPQNRRYGTTLSLQTWFDRLRPQARGQGTEAVPRGASRRRVPTAVFSTLAVAAFFVPIMATNLTGDFGITRDRSYVVPEDIRGSTTLEEVVDNYGLTEEELYNGLGIRAGVSVATALKDLEPEGETAGASEGLSPSLVREVVRYADRPLSELAAAGVPAARVAEAASAAGLPLRATLKELMRVGPRGVAVYLFSSALISTGGVGADGSGEGAGSGGDVSAEAQQIKGSTTLAQIQAMDVDYAAFVEEFGIPAGTSLEITLKELSALYGFEMSEVRAYLDAITR